ncbi:MAG: endonuclease [Phycisphaerales bacterium]|nr:endonuclease [Phycisphaerales bacterium]
MKHTFTHAAFGILLIGLAGSATNAQDEFSPPAGYYAGATGTGAALKSQLTSAMSAGHIQRTYGNFRDSAILHDQDPNNSSNIILVYNLASINGGWDSGQTWNREHVWPQSRQPGSASNSVRGNLGDPHALRPANPSINSSRGNKPFGNPTTIGNFRSLGTFYFPGDTDKGDIARSLFYSATRYASSGLTLVNGNPNGNRMGDLASLIAWHYLDTPDTFERRRNHTIYSIELNPSFRTNNRNAYVDHPEFAWSVYMDQMNDTTLWFGDLEPADGSSTIDLSFNAIVGESIPAMDFMLNKSGADGTYYSVAASEGMISSINGMHNAFAMSPVNLDEIITLSFDSSVTKAAGTFNGDVRVNNLDVTTQGGVGNGDNDVDDMIFVSIDVFNSGNGSFDEASDINSLNLDLGNIAVDGGTISQTFAFFNLAQGGILGAPIDIELVSIVGDTGSLTTDFTTVSSLVPSGGPTFDAILDDQAGGSFSATYTFRVYNDRSLFASKSSVEDLVLVLTGSVGDLDCPADFAEPFGELNFFDVSAFLGLFAASDPAADLNGDGEFNFFDVSSFLVSFGAGCP